MWVPEIGERIDRKLVADQSYSRKSEDGGLP